MNTKPIHSESPDCPCEPRVVNIPGHQVILHRAMDTGVGKVGRRKIAGLPEGWIIVGRHPSAEVMTEAQRKSEADSAEAARRRRDRIRREESSERRKWGMP